MMTLWKKKFWSSGVSNMWDVTICDAGHHVCCWALSAQRSLLPFALPLISINLCLTMIPNMKKMRMTDVGTALMCHITNTFGLNCCRGSKPLQQQQGIKMTILFTPLPAPLAPGKKCWVNARQPVIMKINYFHEDIPLCNVLTKTLTMNLNREDLFECSWLFQGEQLDDPNSLSLSYTIPCQVTDQVNISNKKDYKQMVDEATSKSPFEVKLFIIENKVRCIDFCCVLHYNASI